MKIIDIQRFINKFKVLTEAVTLPNIRQGILGKKGMKEYPIVDDEKEWYEEHKSEILSTIEKALNVKDKTLKIKLQKFDTDDFFTGDKPRKLKIRELLKAVRRNFISQVERSRMSEDKTSGIEAQYEMMGMKNGVEVYAVYTPMANRYLTHTKLWVQDCFSPTWCIASSTANNYWNMYHLYEAEYPSVFIVAQKTKNGYNKQKYELKCNPRNSVSFRDGEISLKDWVDEWRNPQQSERDYLGTSLFKKFNISLEDLENTIRELVNSKKAERFSEKFGKEMLGLYTKKINSKDEDTKMEYLTKACKNGTFINFCDKIDQDDKEYFLDELIRYETLTEMEVQKMNMQDKEKALSYLIKMKRCTHKSLEWANRYFDKNMVRRVYHSLPDEILSLEVFEGIKVRVAIFENIKKDKGLTEEFVNYQIKNEIVNHTTLEYVKDDKELLKKSAESMIKNGKVDNKTLECVQSDKELLIKCVENMVKNGKVDDVTLEYVKDDKVSLTKCVEILIKYGKVNNKTLYYVQNDKVLLRKCVDYLIKNNKVDNYMSLRYVKDDKELLRKCVENLIKNNKVDNYTLDCVKNDKELFKKCVEFLIKNDKVDTLHYVQNDKELLIKCVENLIKNDRVNNDALYYVQNDKVLLRMCVENLIKNDEVDNTTLKLVNRDEELLRMCVENLIKNGKVDNKTFEYVKKDKVLFEKCFEFLIKNGGFNNYTFDYIGDEELLKMCVEISIKNGRVNNYILDYVKDDKESLRMCVESMIKNDRVNDKTLYYVQNDKVLLRMCVENLIKNGKVNYWTLEYVGFDKESLRMCVESMIKNDRVNNDTLGRVKNDEELFKKCVESMIKNDRVNNDTLHYVRNDKALLRICVNYLIKNGKVNKGTLTYVKNDEELLRKCVEYLISKNKYDYETLNYIFKLDDNISVIKNMLIYLVDKNKEHDIYYAVDGRYNNFNENNITTLCKILDEREMNDVLRSLLSYEDSIDNYYIRLYEEILKRCSILTKLISCSMLFAREKNLRINDTLNTTFKNAKDDARLLKSLVGCFISSGYKSYFDKALNDNYEGRYALYYLIDCFENDVRGDYFEKSIENIEKFENTYEDFVSFLKQNKEYSKRAEMWIGYPLFGETEEKDKITQMKNLYKLFLRKWKENGHKSNEEIVNIIREMIDIGFYKSIKTSYTPLYILTKSDNISGDNVKMMEEILKQIGEENYNDSLLSVMTGNKKFYKFIPHIVDVLISKNDIGTSLIEIINDGVIIDVNSAKKLANWIIKNKNTIDKETKKSVNFIKENYPEIYKELFGDKL